MTHRKHNRHQAGFTLIEVMVAAAIIGILASVAIPNYQKFVLRAKTAERTEIMNRIKQQVQDFYLRKGASIDPIAHPGMVTIDSMYNPEWPPVAQKRMMNTSAAAKPVWAEYFSSTGAQGSQGQEIEGPLYYTYYFRVQESPALSQIIVWSWGDLDSDGALSTKIIVWNRQSGVYQNVAEVPPAGQEDDVTYGTF
jgi:prepilin-type N-terminal cleavage/methylation domain-containing protein